MFSDGFYKTFDRLKTAFHGCLTPVVQEVSGFLLIFEIPELLELIAEYPGSVDTAVSVHVESFELLDNTICELFQNAFRPCRQLI